MPGLDRRITVRRTTTGRNEYGEAETAAADYQAWARRVDRSQEDIEQEGGALNLARRDYVIRYRPEIADALISELQVLEAGVTLDVVNVITETARGARRRMIRLEAVGEAAA
ncbi:head-tail adaptor protein [Candidatus Palauibacter sp.]|uniref:phage head completion protein n=1 Tax=Candidatus Palauibacter sp. TaxID=3101350 RepID=UPI003B01BB79